MITQLTVHCVNLIWASVHGIDSNRIKQAITFLSLTLDSDTLPKVERVMAFIRNWSGVLGKAARQTNRERLEELSEQPVSFGDIDDLVKCQALHQQLRDTVEMAKQGTPVSGQDIHDLTVWVVNVKHKLPERMLILLLQK